MSQPARADQKRPGRPELRASDDRLLLESRSLDLFETGKSVHVYICPECHHELLKVVCLGQTVRACPHCRGLWISYAEVRELSPDVEWFRQLGPALQLALTTALQK